MSQHDRIATLDYATTSQVEKPRRDWILLAFLIVVVGGELIAVPRLYRWGWPQPADYLLALVLFAGAVTMALVTRLEGWIIGLYGVIGICSFYPGQTMTREFRMDIGEPGAMRLHLLGWSAAVLVTWLICRSTVLLRRPRSVAC